MARTSCSWLSRILLTPIFAQGTKRPTNDAADDAIDYETLTTRSTSATPTIRRDRYSVHELNKRRPEVRDGNRKKKGQEEEKMRGTLTKKKKKNVKKMLFRIRV